MYHGFNKFFGTWEVGQTLHVAVREGGNSRSYGTVKVGTFSANKVDLIPTVEGGFGFAIASEGDRYNFDLRQSGIGGNTISGKNLPGETLVHSPGNPDLIVSGQFSESGSTITFMTEGSLTMERGNRDNSLGAITLRTSGPSAQTTTYVMTILVAEPAKA